MTSLVVLSTALSPSRPLGRLILACALVLLTLGAAVTAQGQRTHTGKRDGKVKAAIAARRAAAAKATDKATADAPSSPRPPSPKPVNAEAEAAAAKELTRVAVEAWDRLTRELMAEYFARHPDMAFEIAWPGARELGLGAFGAEGGLRWRAALTRARGELGRLVLGAAPWEKRAEVRVLSDWVEAELLMLDTQALPTRDPASHVQQAYRTLQAAAEAAWIPAEERGPALAALLAGLPDHLDQARRGLLAYTSPWIDQALRDLDDLEELVSALSPAPKELAPRPPVGGKNTAPVREDPRQAIQRFRSWLLGIRASAGARPPTLDGAEWTRLVQLVSGKAWASSEIKAACLRDLAQLELPTARRSKGGARPPMAKRLELRTRGASDLAFQVGVRAQLLRMRPRADRLAFGSEESPRSRLACVSTRPGDGDTLRVLLQLPHPSWSLGRSSARIRELGMLRLTALGARHGLAGEGLFESIRRERDDPLRRLPVNRLQGPALGLFAQDWLARVDWVENSFTRPRVRRELELQRGYEAARLLTTLELHTEGISLAEAAAGFRRRTGVSEDVAAAEALASQRDPLRGMSYLGLLELRALEQRLAPLTTPRKALALVLALAFAHPTLRASDLSGAPVSVLHADDGTR